MTLSNQRWRKLFLFCLGLTVASTLCMKWMESDFRVGGQLFTIMGLELFYSKDKVMAVLTGMDGHVKTILDYHLHFDFVFMAGIFPGIAALCMMAREKVSAVGLRKLLFVMACLQLPAWGCDITENSYLLHWIKDPAIGDDFGFYHFIVASKWIIALAGALLAIVVLLIRRFKKG
jgi:hypothetical protein